MKKFEFRLDSALRLRNTELRREKLKLQQLIAEEQRLGDSLLALTKERQAAVESVQKFSMIAAGDLRALSSFLVGAELLSNKLREQMAAKYKSVETQRGCVIAAERNVKVLDKLKTQRLAEWNHLFDLELEALAQDAWNSANMHR